VCAPKAQFAIRTVVAVKAISTALAISAIIAFRTIYTILTICASSAVCAVITIYAISAISTILAAFHNACHNLRLRHCDLTYGPFVVISFVYIIFFTANYLYL
jgi:hypothetical protein